MNGIKPTNGLPSSGGGKTKFNFVPLLILVLVAYVSFLLYQAVYFNYKTSQKINALKSDTLGLEDQKLQLEALISYYKTDSFAELEARKKLGMKMPGEKVIKVDVEPKVGQNDLKAEEIIKEPQTPNWQEWIYYLEGKD